MDITLQIYRDKMVLIHEANTATVHPGEPYTTTRLLVGTFDPAVACLKEGLKKIGASGFLKK